MASEKNNIPHDSERWKLRRNPKLEAVIGERVVTVIGEPDPHGYTTVRGTSKSRNGRTSTRTTRVRTELFVKQYFRVPPEWLKPGARVDYHAVIGREVTEAGMVVEVGPQDHYGQWVVWLKGKAGCVAMEAVTLAKEASAT